MGKEEDRSAHKKMHTQELVKFSEVVYNLVQDQDPHISRINHLSAMKKQIESPKSSKKGEPEKRNETPH